MPDDPVLVTGGTGFLARHTVLRLLKSGHSVRASVRSPARAETLRDILHQAGAPVEKLQIVAADLLDRQSWRPALDGVRHVLHLAAAMQGGDVRAAARDGTRNVLEASAEAGVERVVLTSTGLAALRPDRPLAQGERVSEADWTDTGKPGLDIYTLAKTQAEQDAWRLSETLGLPLATILPGVILGPSLGPERSLWQSLIADMLAGKLPLLPPMQLQMVDVRDVADLHIAALFAEGAAGQRYLAATDTLSLAALADILKQDLGDAAKRVSNRQMPVWLFRLLARVSAAARAGLPLIGASPELDAGKARRDLGWAPRTARASIGDTARSLIAQQ